MIVNQPLTCEEDQLDKLISMEVVDNYRPLGIKRYLLLLKTNLSKEQITEIYKAVGSTGESRKALVTSNVAGGCWEREREKKVSSYRESLYRERAKTYSYPLI
uniref:Uncharacterized protein n=1 Tax=Microbotryum lychnidis-dioicae TaxID=288795 RepID=M1GMT6_9BASI|nr:hypothetical protein H911_mgp22 [Microbotryum lychnidis-dioicae]YP_007475386.1 hypothetical protein H911_mgp18 [Microbotryum lychnidis-dioicae]AGE14596.1 hypothetical protein [Microbotryum lychnidis-dioicae]AGE14600.1 hypothetical protein [Microbotryum lychnidis-dioicae]